MKLPASSLIGWGVVAVAAVVMAGWLLREPAILRALPGTLMVFNTALGFALAGLAFGAEGIMPEAGLQRLRVALKGAQPGQIAQLCEAVGLQVLSMKRIRLGRVPLGKLPPGQWRYLRGDERF